MELPSVLIGDTIRRGQIFHSSIFQDINHGKFFVVIGVTETEVAGFFLHKFSGHYQCSEEARAVGNAISHQEV